MHTIRPHHVVGLGQAATPTELVAEIVADPVARVAKAAITGAAGGALVAATIGLAGQAVGPGNRMAVLALLAIPVAGTIVGVMMTTEKYR